MYPCPYAQGMMGGPGMGYGRMAPSQDLDEDDVRTLIGRHLEWRGNPRLKVGNVKDKDSDTIIAEIVTVDGSLVSALKWTGIAGG